MRVAALDDDVDQLELTKYTLQAVGHDCHVFQDGDSLLRELRRESYDLLVLDWSLPDMSGPEIVQWIRDNLTERIPILFLTNRREERDIVEGLSCGADDFMSKPLRMGELVARTTALLRRAYPESMGARMAFGAYCFDADKRSLSVHGQPIELKNREYELALFMFRNAGRLLSRTHLREAVWGDGAETPSRSLDTHMSRLRTKLELTEDNGYTISAIYGMGYRLDPVGAPALHRAPAQQRAAATETLSV